MLLRKALYMHRVLKQQFMFGGKLRKFQLEALNELLASVRNVPFYRGKYKNRIESIDELKKLPTTTREEFLNAGIAVYNKGFKQVKKEELRQRTTSGSTGLSFKIKYDERAWDYLEAVYARAFFAQGYNPVYTMAYYWYEPLKTKFQNYLGLFRRHYIPCKWPLGKQIEELKRHNFRYIHYFSSVLYYISRIIKPADAARIRPKIIFTHAELLSPKMRERIEHTFRCKVYDMYGTTEFVRMAWECPVCGGYHVDEDSILLEILDEHDNPCKPGELGRFVVTGLANYLLPLIRYEMGDYGMWSTKMPKCGRGLRLIEGVEGRDNDFLISTTGKRIPPKQVIDALDGIKELAIFKVVQTGDRSFEVRAKPKRGMRLPEDEVIRSLKPLLGGGARIVVINSQPQISSRGKLRLVERK